jgi:YVTN family beta-propeller protein
VRKTVATLIGPDATDISSTYRMPAFPFGTGTYFAFIANRGGNNVAIFESGPSQPTFLGPDDVNIVLTEGPLGPINGPVAVADDRTFNPGCYFIAADNRTVGRTQLTFFAAPPLPNFPSQGALREFRVTSQSDPLDPFKPIGVAPTDICIGDNIFLCQLQLSAPAVNVKAATTSGMHGVARRLYVANAGDGTVSVLDATNLLNIGTIPIPGVRLVSTFYP